MPAVDCVSSKVKKSLLILAEAMIMLIVGGVEVGSHLVERGIGRPPIVDDAGISILIIRDRHRPVRHFQ